jgi:hypothetical protein
MRHRRQVITPEQAARWLARLEALEHHELRTIDQRLVDHFARKMKNEVEEEPDEPDEQE